MQQWYRLSSLKHKHAYNNMPFFQKLGINIEMDKFSPLYKQLFIAQASSSILKCDISDRQKRNILNIKQDIILQEVNCIGCTRNF